ncbi:MAG: hypothetical protein QM497_05315 [Sulfurimonas sp.]
MSKQNIKQLFDATNELLTELAVVSTKHGYHLDNDLESGLLQLLLDDDLHEMSLLKTRIEAAITKMKNGTFKLNKKDTIFSDKREVA